MSDESVRERGRSGPKSRDWEGLFEEWLKSGVPKAEFLTSKDISPYGGRAIKMTAHWEDALRGARAQMEDQMVAQLAGKRNQRHAQVVEAVVVAPSEELAIVPGERIEDQAARAASLPAHDRPPVLRRQDDQSWQKIVDWRGKQATQDWRTSDTIRLHIGLILKHGLQEISVHDEETGKKKKEYRSMLRASDIRQLAMAAADVQRMQRLALGLSTENIGVESPDPNVDRTESPDTPNLFVVELTKNGKFTRARPRRVS